jgi:AraC family transcriptional regulator
VDTVVTHLGLALLPAFENPDQASLLFFDYVTMALCAHVVHRYGNGPAKWIRGGLTPRQERRAKELLSANLDGEVCLSDLARDCGLSVSHFIRAFRKSTGIPPHRWLLHQRVAKAKDLLRSSSLTISEIALACGFVDQSHLNRVFVRMVGASPGVWRREHEV